MGQENENVIKNLQLFLKEITLYEEQLKKKIFFQKIILSRYPKE